MCAPLLAFAHLPVFLSLALSFCITPSHLPALKYAKLASAESCKSALAHTTHYAFEVKHAYSANIEAYSLLSVYACTYTHRAPTFAHFPFIPLSRYTSARANAQSGPRSAMRTRRPCNTIPGEFLVCVQRDYRGKSLSSVRSSIAAAKAAAALFRFPLEIHTSAGGAAAACPSRTCACMHACELPC